REALATAAGRAGFAEPSRRKNRASTTELEVMRGAVSVPDAREHVFAFFRTVANLDDVRAALPEHAPAELRDVLPAGGWNGEAWNALQRLKDLLVDRIGENNVWRYQVGWAGGALVLDGDVEISLCEEVWRRLSGVIIAQMDVLDREAQDPLDV